MTATALRDPDAGMGSIVTEWRVLNDDERNESRNDRDTRLMGHPRYLSLCCRGCAFRVWKVALRPV